MKFHDRNNGFKTTMEEIEKRNSQWIRREVDKIREEKMRAGIEDAIEESSKMLRDSSEWWATEYDSAGSLPNTEIERLLDRIIAVVKTHGKL